MGVEDQPVSIPTQFGLELFENSPKFDALLALSFGGGAGLQKQFDWD